jgi:hypothetical protein
MIKIALGLLVNEQFTSAWFQCGIFLHGTGGVGTHFVLR